MGISFVWQGFPRVRILDGMLSMTEDNVSQHKHIYTYYLILVNFKLGLSAPPPAPIFELKALLHKELSIVMLIKCVSCVSTMSNIHPFATAIVQYAFNY